MASVEQHYDNVLADVYSWMYGGWDAALTRYQEFFAKHGIVPRGSRRAVDLDRFIPVRSDERTIFTCFLEYEPETVKVHDLVYRRVGESWQFHKSFYRKLRLSTRWVEDALRGAGFAMPAAETDRGLVTIVARK